MDQIILDEMIKKIKMLVMLNKRRSLLQTIMRMVYAVLQLG